MHGKAKSLGGRRRVIVRGGLVAACLSCAHSLFAGESASQAAQAQGQVQAQPVALSPLMRPVYLQANPFPLRSLNVDSRTLLGQGDQVIRPASYSRGLPVSPYALGIMRSAALAGQASTEATETTKLPKQYFFPLVTPVLGGTSCVPVSQASPGAIVPASLAFLSQESFYQALVMRLAANQLNPEMDQAVYAYCVEKARLRAEFLTLLQSLAALPLAEREARLTAARAGLEPGIHALETQEEALRSALAGGLRWRSEVPESGVATPVPPPSWRSLRDVAFLQAGLSGAQRRLLFEAAAELALAPSSKQGAEGAEDFIYFGPEPSRVARPSGLDKESAARLELYLENRGRLKAVLLGLVVELGRTPGEERRQDLCLRLARDQEPLFAALEQEGEALRPILGSSLRAQGAAASEGERKLPSDLVRRLDAYNVEKTQLQQALLARIAEVRRGLSSTVAQQERDALTKATIAEFTRENAARYAALERTKEGLRDALVAAQQRSFPQGTTPDGATEQLARGFSNALSQALAEQHHGLMEQALFEPGLAPVQRRFLLKLGMVGLGQPVSED